MPVGSTPAIPSKPTQLLLCSGLCVIFLPKLTTLIPKFDTQNPRACLNYSLQSVHWHLLPSHKNHGDFDI